MAEIIPELPSERIKEYLFVKNEDGNYRGWRGDLLMGEISKIEKKFLFCCVCHGLLREACFFINANKQELRCSVCLPSKDVTVKRAKINQASVNEKHVHCPLLERGCKWSDSISEVLFHLNECEFFAVECPLGCLTGKEGNENIVPIVQIERRFLEEHQKVSCPMRLIDCESCYSQIKACEINYHIAKCEEYVILCPNACTCIEGEDILKMKRKHLPSHLGGECPLQEVECPYAEYGCKEKMERRLVSQHEKESIHMHFRNSIIGLREQSCQVKLLEREKCRIETEIDNVKEYYSNEISLIKNYQKNNVSNLKKLIELLTTTLKYSPKGSLNWKVTEVLDKIRNKETIYSEPFYVGLYKCQSSIAWDYEGRGYVGCFLHVLKGDWDDRLTFPFKWKYTFALINRSATAHHYVRSCHIDEDDLRLFPRCFEQPQEFGNSGFGMVEFISHEDIQKKEFMENDLILLKINIE